MKKIASFLILAVAGLGLAVAQNFTLEINGIAVTEGLTIEADTIVDNEEVFDVKAYIVLTNTSSSQMTFSANVSTVNVPEDAFITVCGFGTCFPGPSIPAQVMEPGEVRGEDHLLDALDIAYTPNAAYDECTVACTFTDGTAGESLNFNIRFIPRKPADVANENLENKAAIAAYPNPAVDQVQFRLDNVKAGSRVLLRDLTGKTVRAQDVNGLPELNMSLTGLSSGMYFYCVEENGSNVAVGKLMVR